MESLESQVAKKNLERALSDLTIRVLRLEQAVFGPKKIAPAAEIFLEVDLSELTYVRELKSTLAMCLSLLDHFFKADPSHAGLSPDQMVSILHERFGVPIPLPSVSAALYRATGTLVTRKQAPGTPVRYRYRILPKGQEFIRQKIEELKS